jgi:hypothetical protein
VTNYDFRLHVLKSSRGEPAPRAHVNGLPRRSPGFRDEGGFFDIKLKKERAGCAAAHACGAVLPSSYACAGESVFHLWLKLPVAGPGYSDLLRTPPPGGIAYSGVAASRQSAANNTINDNVAGCCHPVAKNVATLILGNQRCNRCCHFSHFIYLLSVNQVKASQAWSRCFGEKNIFSEKSRLSTCCLCG